MRTTTKYEKSKYKVILCFLYNGWTFSYFDNKHEIKSWIIAMEGKHGTITLKETKEL